MGHVNLWFNPVYFFENKAWLALVIAITISHGWRYICVHSPLTYSIKTSSSHEDHCSWMNPPKSVEWCSKSLSPPKTGTLLLLCNPFISTMAMCDLLTPYFFWERHQLRHLNTTHMFDNFIIWVVDFWKH